MQDLLVSLPAAVFELPECLLLLRCPSTARLAASPGRAVFVVFLPARMRSLRSKNGRMVRRLRAHFQSSTSGPSRAGHEGSRARFVFSL